VPRAPLPGVGVTHAGTVSSTASEGVTPSFLAPTSPCAGPNPSLRLRVALCRGSLQVAASPCWEMALPDVVSADLSPDAWPSLPADSHVALPISSRVTSAFPADSERVGFRNTPLSDFRADSNFERINIPNVQASGFACHPDRSHRCRSTSTGQPWRLHPSRTRVVAFPCIGYASRPNRAIDGRGLSPHQARSLVGCSLSAGVSGRWWRQGRVPRPHPADSMFLPSFPPRGSMIRRQPSLHGVAWGDFPRFLGTMPAL
jgi:hypothetical protein